MAARNILEIVINATDNASDVVNNVVDSASSTLKNLSQDLIMAGAGLALMVAPLAGALGDATNQAVAFEETMTNVNSVLQLGQEDAAALNQEILDFGTNSKYGPQKTAEAFYDIVGGVADASTHMAILEAATRTAEAGNADLQATTQSLISTMNSYAFAAEDAAYVSDVLTAVVGAGVGTMDEFAASLPQVTGLANALGIEFDELGGMMAYMTTQGYSASNSATLLKAMMSTLMNPTADLAEIIGDLGYESGTAMIEALGLAGAYEAIADQAGGFEGIITNQEALQGALALTNDSADEFLTNFSGGMTDSQQAMYDFILASEGLGAAREYLDNLGIGFQDATEKARDIQMDSRAAEAALFKSAIEGLRIEIGNALLPALSEMLTTLRPIITSVMEWVGENPKLIAGVGAVVVGAMALAGILTAVGTALGIVAGGMAILFSPIGAVIALVGALYLAWEENFLGIQDAVEPVLKFIKNGLNSVKNTLSTFVSEIQNVGLKQAISNALGGGGGFSIGAIEGIDNLLSQLGVAEGSFIEFIDTMQVNVGIMGDSIAEALGATGGAFTEVVLPDLLMVAEMIVTTVVPAFFELATFLLENLPLAIAFAAELWTSTLLPALINIYLFVTDTLVPMFVELASWLADQIPPAIQMASDVWNNVLKPALEAIWNFITTTLIPAISSVVGWLQDNIPAAVQIASDIWTSVLQPALQAIWDFVTNSVIPMLSNMAGWLQENIPVAVQAASDVWANVLQPAIQAVIDFFTTNILPIFAQLETWLLENIPVAVQAASDVWDDTLYPALVTINAFLEETLLTVLGTLVAFLQDTIPVAVAAAADVWSTVLKPALDDLWVFIEEALIPTLYTLWQYFATFLQDAISGLGIVWEGLRQGILTFYLFIVNSVIPVLSDLWDYFFTSIPAAINVLKTKFDEFKTKVGELKTDILNFIDSAITPMETAWQGIVEVLNSIATMAGSVGEALAGIGDRVPDWMIPGSPTPFEIGLLGIVSAMKDLSRLDTGGMFGQGLAAAGLPTSAAGAGAFGGGNGGGNTINITVQVTGDKVNDPNTQRNAESFGNQIAEALKAQGVG